MFVRGIGLLGLLGSLYFVYGHAALWNEVLILSVSNPIIEPAPSVSCSTLNPDEQQFAYGLTDDNRALFCTKFTSTQRAAAMQMTSQPSPTGALISPDEAVLIVAKANQIVPGKESPTLCPTK
jgi:hypothetical protein